MSKTHPRTPEEWDEFRFPSRSASALSSGPGSGLGAVGMDGLSDEDEDEGDGEAGGADGGWGDAAYEPIPPRVTTWIYVPDQRRFVHLTRNKQVLLDRLDESSKIVRLLAVFESQALDPEDFADALERASGLHHRCSLDALLRTHADGRSLSWPELDASYGHDDVESTGSDERAPRRSGFGH